MPNWVNNSLEVTGLTPTEKEKLVAAAKEEKLFDFVLPQPDWNNTPNEKGDLPKPVTETWTRHGKTHSHTFNRFPDGSDDDRWYGWRNHHWGTKWGDCDGILPEDNDETIFSYEFCSAWAPPNTSFLTAFSKLFPNAEITNRYAESDFFGVSVAKGGIAIDGSEDTTFIEEKWLKVNAPEIEDTCDLYEEENEEKYEEFMEVQCELIEDRQDFMYEELVKKFAD